MYNNRYCEQGVCFKDVSFISDMEASKRDHNRIKHCSTILLSFKLTIKFPKCISVSVSYVIHHFLSVFPRKSGNARQKAIVPIESHLPSQFVLSDESIDTDNPYEIAPTIDLAGPS